MVLADWFRAKYVTPLKEQRKAEVERRRAEEYAEGLAEGRAEAIAEVNRVWRAWNRRRMDAKARGEPFTEPDPYQDRE